MEKRLRAPRGVGRNPETLQNGPAIRQFREWARYSVTFLAAQAGISRSTLANIEAERRSTNDDVIEKIAEALEIDPQAIRREKSPKVAGRTKAAA